MLVDFRGKSVVQFAVGLVIAVLVAILIGNLAIGLGLNPNMAYAAAGAGGLAGDYIAGGILTWGKQFKRDPLVVLKKTTLEDFNADLDSGERSSAGVLREGSDVSDEERAR